jgi:hypothetical protein
MHVIISHHYVRREAEVSRNGWVRGQGEPGGGLRGRWAVAGVAVCRRVERLR